jgi:hypothetical protein
LKIRTCSPLLLRKQPCQHSWSRLYTKWMPWSSWKACAHEVWIVKKNGMKAPLFPTMVKRGSIVFIFYVMKHILTMKTWKSAE